MAKVKFNLGSPVQFFALGFGSGLVPKAPGTMGTLVAIPLFMLLGKLPIIVYLGIVLILALIGVYLCGQAAKQLGVHDHPAIVWDEIVGYLITMCAMPMTWQSILLGFVLFRFFDIVKPWPISYLDKHCHGGLGIMLDDIVAGLMAWCGMYSVVTYL
ncbi:phosphatidylglycerophosphatase A family protein [Thalassotalea ganghwensis]